MDHLNRALAFVALVLSPLLFSTACGVAMTPQIIHDAGTHKFHAPYAKVFAATETALTAEGFPIAASQPEKGMITTGQKLIGAVGGGGVAVAQTRQYVVHVNPSGDGTVVVAEPRIFQGNAEVTDQPVWVIEGPEGERALWQRFFRDVQENL
jgi:hypothetical protein